mgnify:CR=1 FL=1
MKDETSRDKNARLNLKVPRAMSSKVAPTPSTEVTFKEVDLGEEEEEFQPPKYIFEKQVSLILTLRPTHQLEPQSLPTFN